MIDVFKISFECHKISLYYRYNIIIYIATLSLFSDKQQDEIKHLENLLMGSLTRYTRLILNIIFDKCRLLFGPVS